MHLGARRASDPFIFVVGPVLIILRQILVVLRCRRQTRSTPKSSRAQQNAEGHLTGLGESAVTTPRTHHWVRAAQEPNEHFASSPRTSPCWRIAISSSSASPPSIHSAWRRR